MGTLVERVCKCGCGESFMARLRDVERGYGNYKNRSHASKGTKNPSWKGGRSSKPYFYKLRYMAKNPEKFKARQTLLRSVNAGILKRGCCEFCGDPNTQGHHEDYDHPYQVRWLCRKDHRLVDRWRRQRERSLQPGVKFRRRNRKAWLARPYPTRTCTL